MNGRPRVFTSSTIFDFRDLRSALKFWLEELGYEPLMSEHNDFEKPLDTDSYTACLKSIEAADYFILLIGQRRGGWYDEIRRVTITRAEYEHAYRTFKDTGRPKIVTFIRRTVLDVREDRKAVAKGLGEPAQTILAAKPSPFVEDPTVTFAFIDEVRRLDEMKSATKNGTGFPVGNWVHAFDQFRDVVDVLRSEFLMSRSLRRAALGENLRHELLGNLAELLGKSKTDGTLKPKHVWAGPARNAFIGGPTESSTYQVMTLGQLSMFRLYTMVGERLSVHALDEAIRSTEFMEWDRTKHAHRVGPFQAALLGLRRNIERLIKLESLAKDLRSEEQAVLSKAMTAHDKSKTVTVANMTLAGAFASQDAHINVIKLLRGLCLALDGQPEVLSNIDLKANRPFADDGGPISFAVDVTIPEVEAFVRSEGTRGL